MREVPLQCLMYFLVGMNTNKFIIIPEKNYFAPLGILNLFIKSFVNLFVNIADNIFVDVLIVPLIHFYLNLSFLQN